MQDQEPALYEKETQEEELRKQLVIKRKEKERQILAKRSAFSEGLKHLRDLPGLKTFLQILRKSQHPCVSETMG